MLSRSAKRRVLGIFFGTLTLILLLSLVNLYFAALERRQRAEEERAGLVPPAALRHTVETRTLREERTFAGRLEPWRAATLAAESEGRILTIRRETGDAVEEGDILAEIDPTLPRLALEASEKARETRRQQVREAARQVREGEELLRSRSIPESEVESRRARLAIEEAELARLSTEVARAEALLDRHTLRAPFSGVIGQRMIDEGDRVMPGQAAFQLVDLARLRLIFQVGETERTAFSPGTEIRFQLSSARGEEHRARIGHLAPSRGPAGNFRVEAPWENTGTNWPGGLQVVVTAPLILYEDLPFIPAAAVRFDGPRTTVLRALGEDGEAERIAIEVGPEIDGQYPVLKGLMAGEVVIIR